MGDFPIFSYIFHTFSIHFPSTLVIFLTVCHGKIHHAIKNGINHLFRLGPSKNHGYVSHNQRVAVMGSPAFRGTLRYKFAARRPHTAWLGRNFGTSMWPGDLKLEYIIIGYYPVIIDVIIDVILDVIIDVISGYIPRHPSYPVIRWIISGINPATNYRSANSGDI